MSEKIHADRLFLGSCFSLIATSVAFAVVGAVMGALKQEFLLSNEQVGYIGGAAIWGFTLSIFAFGPLVDTVGMGRLLRFSLFCHIVGPLLMVFANGFGMLFVGALVIALGNGTVEAVCNPLVATIYPDRKTEKLNQFHVWFPGGIVIGAILAFALDKIGFGAWQLKLLIILVPAIIYGILFTGHKFPESERVQSGVSFGGMFAAAFGRPLFYILILSIAITASLELGPGRWIPAVLEAGGIPGILVLAYINGLMAVLRYYAGPVVEKLSNTGILMASAVLSGIGLMIFSYADTTLTAFLSATIFAVGVCYFWPTILGTASERIPKSGALGLALLGGTGMLVVGTVTSPQMGRIADNYLYDRLDLAEVQGTLQEVVQNYPVMAANEPPVRQEEIGGAVTMAQNALAEITKEQSGLETNPNLIIDALRSAAKNAPPDASDLQARINGEILGPADNYGGRISFRYVAPLAIIIILIFSILHFDHRKKNNKAKTSVSETQGESA